MVWRKSSPSALTSRVLALIETDKAREWTTVQIAPLLDVPVMRVVSAMTTLHRQRRVEKTPQPSREMHGARCTYRFLDPEYDRIFDAAELTLAIGRMTAIGPFRPSIQGEQP